MGRRCRTTALMLASIGIGFSLSAQAAPPTRPNIVVMMADDMGWASMDFAVRLGEDSDGAAINYAGTKNWKTPNFSAMASNGLVFSRMYSQSPVCSPTRASVLTGRSPERMGIPFANTGSLPNREVTIAEYARSLGYTTGHFGKWHLGVLTRELRDANRGGKKGSHRIYSTPLGSGFGVQYSTESKVATYEPATSGLTAITRYWTGPGDFVPLDSAELSGDDSAIIARETNAFIEQAADSEDPFLAVCWFHTPHKPINTPGNANVNNLAAYRFAMEDLDTAIGTLRSKIRELGLADNTILLFTSDNGPEDGQDYDDEGLRANKRELYEGGVRVPGLIEWQGQIAPGVTHTPMVTTDYLPTLLDIWDIDAVDSRPLDGQSMITTVFGDREAVRKKTIVFKSTNGHQSAVGVDGRYKLISTSNGKMWSLYDLVADFSETSPLATNATISDADPAIRSIYHRLLTDYNNWAASVANSLSNATTRDYETRVTAVKNGTLKQEPPQRLAQGTATAPQGQVYLERQYVTLSKSLATNSNDSSLNRKTMETVVLPAGTSVHSYLVHFDTASAEPSENLTVTFKDRVIGVISESSLLSASDFLSFADPEFETTATRGLEADDSWTLSNEGHTITVDRSTSPSSFDQVRILTAASFTPRPLSTQ